MDAAEAVIASKLDALRTELAEKVRDEEAYQKWFEEEAAWEGVRAETPDDILAEHERREQHLRGLDEINALEAQVTLLEALQATLGQQHTEKRSAFLALKQRDERSSTQHVWLTLATAAISLIAGWLLSLVGSPSTVLHLFGH
jgi:ribosomal protein L16 Arg81 hydroxylase